MKTKSAKWFICKVAYDKTLENGLEKKVTEQYVVDAESFTEAEARIIEEMTAYTGKAVEVKDLTIAPFGELFLDDVNGGDIWYKATLQYITIDERTEKEKRYNVHYLVQANTLEGARKNVDTVENGTIIDYAIISIKETKIEEVFYNE